ncbi:T9SS type A sorting domain-containing protein, partial [Candidatus Poribacteria bacterium]|nr:T9SS type A sorting domain-containing protein [Candidatus Poribacteria bacterium]
SVSDLSPVAGLINLNRLSFSENNISDLSPIAGLINLEHLGFSQIKNVSDISPLAGLVNLKNIRSWGHSISDISPLANLTKLESVDFCGGNISNLTPLAGLTGLKELYLADENVSDVSPLAGLTGLTRLGVPHNDISNISPLAGLTNLKWLRISDNDISDVSLLANLTNLTWLAVDRNNISDLSPLDRLRENIKLIWHNNPAFPKGGPKIEGPWLWVVFPETAGSHLNDTDWLSEASEGEVTEEKIATHGATEGKLVGDSVWTAHRLPSMGEDNIEDMLNREIRDGTIYGSVSLHSPREQETTMYVGGWRGVRVWLNGVLIYERLTALGGNDYQDFSPVMLKPGRNVLLVAVHTLGSGFFGFEPGTDYTVSMGVGYTFSQTPIHTGDTFILDIHAENVIDLAGWQFDIAFDPTALEAINMTEGDFLKTDGGTTFFQGGTIDNAAGKITGLSAARLSAQGVSGTGTVLQVKFKAKSGGETELALQNFQFGSVTGDSIPAGPHQIRVTVEGRLATGDVNRDGIVSILDLILVAQQLGKRVPAGSPVDVNGDGVVSILDLIRIAQGIGNRTASAAPPNSPAPLSGGEGRVDAAMIEAWIAQARLEDDGSHPFKEGIENLENLLASLIPEETALLANYPNPFNPETWIPYQLSEAAAVALTIYDMNGQLVRHLAVGHQAAGMYRSRSRAAYWDGRNQLGEPVASGLYFYTLTAGDFTATRRMLILK